MSNIPLKLNDGPIAEHLIGCFFSKHSLEKSLMLGKMKGRRRRGRPRMRKLYGITDEMNMNLGKLRVTVRDREAWCAAVRGVTKSQTWPGY